LHLGLNAPPAIFQEVVRATLATWYQDLVTDLPVIRDGMVQMPTGVGLCTSLRPEVEQRDDATIRMSGVSSRR
jgi:galactonate dehydratase